MPNPELNLASEYVRHTDKNIFLTGKAGSGKTTFLQQLKKDCPKRMIITAPTGVAAMNAGGTTLHSFFQIPFAPYVPGTELEIHQFRKNKIDIIKSLNLLVIDEISMVRADVLDSIDVVLRRFRDKTQAFGGVQLLMIGDLHQLPPISRENEWEILSAHYQSPYFFNSHALRQAEPITIELQHIYRQSDPDFIEILNSIRENKIDDTALNRLNLRYLPEFQPNQEQKYITLTTHNRIADNINNHHLQALSGDIRTLEANVADNFPSANYPTERDLALKVGAQVMFVRNDQSSEKLYFNGKIGKITRIDDDSISVECPDNGSPIKVEPVTWKNITYSIDNDNKKIIENVLGTFTQYPLRLAWAITIHKSQGLTFEHAIIDAQSSFTHGQVYVALSRCKSLQGLILSKPIKKGSIITDPAIARYTREHRNLTPTPEQLAREKVSYYKKLIFDCFSFKAIETCFGKFKYLVTNERNRIQVNSLIPIEDIHIQFRQEIASVADKFERQLSHLFSQSYEPMRDAALQERIQKASHYFSDKLKHGISEWLITVDIDIDNKELSKQFEKLNNDLLKSISRKISALKSCQQNFSTQDYLAAIASANIESKNTTAIDTKHKTLYQALKSWREKQAQSENVEAYRILQLKALKRVVNQLPQSKQELLAVEGIGPKTVEKYGDTLLDLINHFSDSSQSVSVSTGDQIKKSRKSTKDQQNKPDTKQLSYDLYQSGKSIDEIADARGLTKGTIETHLEHYIMKGDLDFDQFIGKEKITIISQALEKIESNRLKDVKDLLGDDYSYLEIKLVKNRRFVTEQ